MDDQTRSIIRNVRAVSHSPQPIRQPTLTLSLYRSRAPSARTTSSSCSSLSARPGGSGKQPLGALGTTCGGVGGSAWVGAWQSSSIGRACAREDEPPRQSQQQLGAGTVRDCTRARLHLGARVGEESWETRDNLGGGGSQAAWVLRTPWDSRLCRAWNGKGPNSDLLHARVSVVSWLHW
jgi:hypothetical protein